MVRIGVGDVVKVVILVRVGVKVKIGGEAGVWGEEEEVDEVILVDGNEMSLEIGLGEVNRI